MQTDKVYLNSERNVAFAKGNILMKGIFYSIVKNVFKIISGRTYLQICETSERIFC